MHSCAPRRMARSEASYSNKLFICCNKKKCNFNINSFGNILYKSISNQSTKSVSMSNLNATCTGNLECCLSFILFLTASVANNFISLSHTLIFACNTQNTVRLRGIGNTPGPRPGSCIPIQSAKFLWFWQVHLHQQVTQ